MLSSAVISLAITYHLMVHFVNEEHHLFRLDEIEQMSFVDFTNQMTTGQILDNQTFTYEEGTVNFQLDRSYTNEFAYKVTAKESVDHKRAGWIIYDLNHQFIKWVEGT